jgi:hypothetical protein
MTKGKLVEASPLMVGDTPEAGLMVSVLIVLAVVFGFITIGNVSEAL